MLRFVQNDKFMYLIRSKNPQCGRKRTDYSDLEFESLVSFFFLVLDLVGFSS